MKKLKNNVRRIVAADVDALSQDVDFDESMDSGFDDLETIEDIKEDDSHIEIDNNIANHYIAECERCHGVFISSVMASDQTIESIFGTCPLCDRETTQWLNWIVVETDEWRKVQ